jgi:hypothetical protein
MDPEDASRFTGTFSVHWEAGGREWEQGPEEVPVEEAIAWARRHAEVVQVRVGADEIPFSAGDRQPAGEVLPEWPAEGMVVRPRPIGTPHDGSEQVVDWLVRSDVEMDLPGDDALDRVRGHLEGAPEVAGVVSATRTPSGATLLYRVSARSEGDAVRAGWELAGKAARQALPPELGDGARIVVQTAGEQ